MRLYSIILLVVTAFLACVASASKDIAATTITHRVSRVANEHDDAPTQRSLREYEAKDEDDEERAGLGDALKTGTSKFFESAKLKTYLLQKKTAVDVLNTFKLGDDVAAVLTKSNVETLKKYITMLNNKKTGTTISLIGTLTARYGDDAVAKAIVSAESAPEAAGLAKQLRSELLAAWLKDGQSVDNVFKLLKLSDDGFEALTSRKLEILDEYIAKFNSDKGAHETLLKTLTTGFGGESKFVTILAQAKTDSGTVTMARKLEKGLLSQWGHENLQPDNVMKLLKLDNGVDNVLTSENLRTFQKYIAEFNTKNPNNQVTLLGSLTAKYGEADVARTLVSAIWRRSTEKLATGLQKQQLEGWLKSEMSVDDVFKLLKIKSDGILAMASRKLDTLDEYVLLYNRAKSADETLIGALSKGFGGEGQLANTIMRAVAVRGMQAKATRLQNKQFGVWMEEGLDSSTSVLTKIFNVGGADATNIQKVIASQFIVYYQRKAAAVRKFEHPRRH
ncbi:hypothetical protein PHYPSEUDO_006888 [Phytophthora pseudosyringae]|uniref:RxLR effector protein n=1 Tax=Phytophthora pseudosyringae TaxID=221518 RepID=A0A8T1WGK1_9STRA|nr:hypothetical protein PHYPSEUDO_006888 [Phytophthora pseudosyringae]